MLTNFLIKYSAYLIFPLLGFFLSLLLTRLCIWVLPLVGLIDKPVGNRHIHTSAIPKGGGLAIILAFFTTWLCFTLSDWGYFIGNLRLDMFVKIGLLSSLIIILGIVDDRLELRARVKLLFQIIIAVICWMSGVRLESIFIFELPEALSLVLTVLWIISFVNAFNLIDGMDGLAAGLGSISAICMATVFAVGHSPNDTVVILCLGTCCCGFLFYNFHPAKIFLGDTGSMFLGFMFAIIGIVSTNKSAAATSILVPMLASGVPIFDVVLAIWRRFSRNLIDRNQKNGIASISEGDNEHLHHRIWRKDHYNQKRTTLKLYALSAAFAVIAILNIMKKDILVGISYALMLVLVYTVVRRIAHIELWNTGKAILRGLNMPRKSMLIGAMQPFFDIAGIVAIYLLCLFLFMDSVYNKSSSLPWYICTIYMVVPIALVLNLGGCYRRNWLHGSAPDYIYFARCLLVGYVLLILLDLLGGNTGTDWRNYAAERLLFFALTAMGLLGERLFLRYLKHYLINEFYIEKTYDITLQRIVLCGAGSGCRYFIDNQGGALEDHPGRIIGIIEDDPMFHGQYIFGLEVLGSSTELEKIHKKTGFDKITITKELNSRAKELIIDFCKGKKISLTVWKGEEAVLLEFPSNAPGS